MSAEKKKTRAAVSKGVKFGSYSLAACAIVVVIAVLVNLIVGALPSGITEPDISSSDLYTLTDYSKQVVGNIQTDVTIYHITTARGKDTQLARLLDRYAQLNSHIHVQESDPEISQLASQYSDETLRENSLIVVSDRRNKTVDYSSLYGYSEDAMSAYYSTGSASPDEFHGEQEITSALSYVTSDVLPKIYTLSGHGEYTCTSTVSSAVASQNIEMDTLDLMTAKTVPEDCACLLLLAPIMDLSDSELEQIRAYTENGGNLLICTEIAAHYEAKMNNFHTLLSDYGIVASEGFVIEADSERWTYTPVYLMPNVNSHEITDPILDGKYNVFFPQAQSFTKAAQIRSSLTLTPLLTTSDSAFSRNDMTLETAEKAPSDTDGPFDVAFAAQETIGDNETRAVIFATPFFLNDEFTGYSGNLNLFLNALKWMCSLEENISVVSVKSLTSGGSLEISSSTGTVLSAVITVVVPIAILASGIVYYVRRKKR